MYCVKCRCITETEYSSLATSRNCRLMWVVNASHAETKTQFVKKELVVEVFLIPL